jgi:hypothetical protein
LDPKKLTELRAFLEINLLKGISEIEKNIFAYWRSALGSLAASMCKEEFD